MKLRYPLIALLAVTVGALALVLTHRVDTYAFHYDNVMGTSLDITVRATSEAAAHAAEAAVLRQIDHDAHILSSYDGQSEFSRWFRTRGEAVPVSPELATVLQDFDTWRVRTGGALDPSAETITRVWNAAASRQVLPSEQALAEAVATVRQTHWRVDARAGTAIHLDAAPIALNSFTKSYIVDRAANAARAVPSVDAVIVNSGGDLVARGDWTATIGVTDPRHHADNASPLTRLAIRDRAVATSGGYRRGFDIAGRHYSHIVDPRTGRPTGQVLSATVVADHGVDAGALATSFCVMSPEESERLAATMPGVEFLLVLADGSRIESAGWRGLEVAPVRRFAVPSPIANLYAAEQGWNGGMQLTVTLDLARQFGRRPYVAVWIEDKDHFPVRTLALWFDKTRYLPELHGWYRADRMRAMAEGTNLVDAVSSATRSPGKYTLTWDGKDNEGKLVSPGTYTVAIEAAREHGTYQIIRHDLDFSGTPAHVDLPGNVEIASASLDYRKAGAASE